MEEIYVNIIILLVLIILFCEISYFKLKDIKDLLKSIEDLLKDKNKNQ